MNVREVSKKIKSVTNVRKITKAMQLVSAVKMRKAQMAALEGKPYQQFIEEAISRVSQNLDITISSLLQKNEGTNRKLVILVTSSKGLCGSFNTSLLRQMLKGVDIKNTDFITIGKKGALFLSLIGATIIADFSTSAPLQYVSAAFDLALESYLNGKYADISLFYNKFVSTLRVDPSHEKLLPISLTQELKEEKGQVAPGEYLIEPAAEIIIDRLFRSYIEEKIRFAIIQSEAGEHSARMIAMKNATDNASDVIVNLTSLRNKLRQQKITYELLDMITAKESVEVN